MWTTSRIRKYFLEYFQAQDHTIVDSSPLIPRNDPTLLFTAAGMVQFKNVFKGIEKKSYTRAATSQKCVRAGGKHNDLENVGYTARHHTFFEMLGNFSFGDYFKEEAIEFAWNLITKDFGVSRDRLVITVYIDDDEAARLWRKIAGIPDEKILRIAGSDNFWAAGDTGPCGPCSEIFYDHGAHIPGGPPGSADQDGERFVEIWNLVFMQYDQLSDGRVILPKPSIDTGMGLERISAVLQNVHDNYDTDLFRTLIQASVEETGIRAEGKSRNSHRVIADHLRASAFLIADGVTPSNEGRGYVLRRIMRRAMRHAYLLGTKEPLMHRLVAALVAEMGEAYSELVRGQALITETLRLEEERFRQTLGRGLKLLEEETGKLSNAQPLAGEVAFKLYDTYGFPLDLTQDILRAEHRTVDLQGFESSMAKQKKEARASWTGSGERENDAIWFNIQEKNGASEFLGYRVTEAEGILQSIVIGDALQHEAKTGQDVQLIFNQTPFYGESGGQMGDIGEIKGDGVEIKITNTIKKGTLHVHCGQVLAGENLQIGQALKLTVNEKNRCLLRANHSATHLLHAVLRRRLGDQVTQKGSLVAPDRLRFDFSYALPIPSQALYEIEDDVNRLIRANTEVTTHLMVPEEAIKAGAMALFGEKYGEEVRVVSMGSEGDPGKSSPYSIELCGGTHVSRTGDIGYFKITDQDSVGSGIRRIEARTGEEAEKYARQLERIVQSSAQILKTRPTEEILSRLEALQEERRKFERELKELKVKLASTAESNEQQAFKVIGGVNFLSRTLEGVSAGDLKSIADDLKKQIKSGVVAVGSQTEGKGSIVVAVTTDLTDKLNAIEYVKVAAEAMGGKGGGGRPDMAQAGGPDGHRLPDAIKAIERSLG
ncbi:alanine--tRNA ligase [Caedimonas varicaedens]|uniref:Alanine--tRNA ligase n=1 Tax=Caedimonas varicaedens TaxID=1629334 RepID=A0A0K8MCQ7_9PROT|nr:alanine--tRNA ligase [Caedimonas varicaedens]